MAKVNLKPCPFCGHKSIGLYSRGRYWYVSCNGCEAEPFYETESTVAVSKWNMRYEKET